MHVLTVHISEFKNHDAKIEVHMLNPGDHFERFGGSSRGLLVRKTASLVTRQLVSGCCSDTEYDIHDKSFWEWMSKVVNDKDGKFRAELPPVKVVDGEAKVEV